MRFRIPYAIAVACLSGGAAAAADQEEIVALCRDGHLQARAAIRQLSCDIEVRIPPRRVTNPYTGKLEDRPAEVQHYSWWEDLDVARCIGTFDEITEEFLWKDRTLKHLKTVNKPGLGNVRHVGRLDGPDMLNRSPTAWGYALFYRPESLREMLSPQEVVSAIEEVHGRQRLYKVTHQHDSSYREELFFDLLRNYVLNKTILYPNLQDLSSQHIHEVSRFTEPKPGVYFPASVNYTLVYKGKAELQQTVLFSNVRVNEAVDPGKLQLDFPTGTQVTDTRRGKAYTVGEDEQPIGPESPMGRPRDLAGERLKPTAMQPRTPWATIALWMVAGFGGLAALGFLLIRRRRAVRNATSIKT
jgi:hypothetical protein